MTDSAERYVPAAGHRALTRLYDPFIALTMRERHFRGALADQLRSDLPSPATVVDVGCGTGTFLIDLAELFPDARLIGVDGDEDILAIARAKRRAERIDWRTGLADALPLAERSADAIVMSLVLHHLSPATKRSAFAEAARVLRPAGWLHIADWGPPGDPLMRGAFTLLRCFDGFENTREHVAGRIPALLADAGFERVSRNQRLRTAWGRLELLSARAPTAMS